MIGVSVLSQRTSIDAPTTAVKSGQTEHGVVAATESFNSNQQDETVRASILPPFWKNKVALKKNRALIATLLLAILLAASTVVWRISGRNVQIAASMAKRPITVTPALPLLTPRVATTPPTVQAELATVTLRPASTVVAQQNITLNQSATDAAMGKVPESRAITDKRKVRPTPIRKHKSSAVKKSALKPPPAQSMQEQSRLREAAYRHYQDETNRAARAKLAQQTPQQACADRTNFISRGICESRECEKPERANLKFCSDMRARRVPRDYPN